MSADGSFWAFALQYHKSEPVIANICVLIAVSTPLIAAFLVYLNKKEAMQVKKHSHILKYQKKEKGAKK